MRKKIIMATLAALFTASSIGLVMADDACVAQCQSRGHDASYCQSQCPGPSTSISGGSGEGTETPKLNISCYFSCIKQGHLASSCKKVCTPK